jgi:hypothetical protein
MSLFDTLKGWVQRDALRYLYVPFDAERVDGASPDSEPLVAERDYFRLWLAEMCLTQDRQWFQTWYPTVHSVVRLTYGTTKVDLPHIAGPLELPSLQESNLDQVVSLNHPITALMPYRGGVVEIDAGLLAMQGANQLQSIIGILSRFASLLAVPQVSAAMQIAGPVADGMQDLLGATNGEMALGFHEGFTGKGGKASHSLRAGYLAVVLATTSDLPPSELWVDAQGRLCRGRSLGNAEPLRGHTWMLFRFETRPDRDDLEGLTEIMAPFNAAIEALGEQAPERAESFLRRAIANSLRSPDLSEADRRRVAETLHHRYRVYRDLGLGAEPPELPPIGEAVATSQSADEALARGPLELEEVLGGDRD